MGDLYGRCSLDWVAGVRPCGGDVVGGLRKLAASFVVPGPAGVAIRDRLKHLTPEDEKVLRLVGAHLGSPGSPVISRPGARTAWSTPRDTWAARKRELTAGRRRGGPGHHQGHPRSVGAGPARPGSRTSRTWKPGSGRSRHRLSLPVGEKGTKRAPGGYRSERRVVPQVPPPARRWRTGSSGPCRPGGRPGARGARRQTLWQHPPPPRQAAQLTEAAVAGALGGGALVPRRRRRVRQAVRQRDDPRHPRRRGQHQAPRPAGHLANAPHGRYVLAATVRVPAPGRRSGPTGSTANRAVAYRIHLRRGPRPLVPDRLLAARPPPRRSRWRRPCARGRDRRGHERRPPRRLAPRRPRQPDRRAAAASSTT